MTDIQSLIRSRVDAFVLDLTDLIHRAALEQVQGALGGAEDFEALSKAILKSVGGTPRIRANQLAA